MEPEPGNPQEVEGTLNPATARGRDGNLYLFPRLVAKGNYSRIGIARVLFNGEGDPIGVERMGIALEPEEEYEKRPGGGGCEDPRISFVEPLGYYLMSYTALSEQGPRVALAESQDLLHWKKLGLARFTSYQKVDLDDVDNKDSCLFPVAIKSPSGKEELAILHRPLFPGRRPEQLARHQKPHEIDRDRESIWISYGLLPHVPRGAASFAGIRFKSPSGASVSALGAAKDRDWAPACLDEARVAFGLSRCLRIQQG